MHARPTPLDVLKATDFRRRAKGLAASRVEPLEARRLLSVSFDDENGIVRVTGTAGNDTISLTRVGSDNVIVNDNGTAHEFDLDDVDQGFHVFGEAGDDRITVGSGFAPFEIELDVRGGDGNDSIVGGNNIELFYGEAGNDTLRGNGLGDQLTGGSGNDIIDGGSGDDTIQGEAGNDSLNGGDGDDQVVGGSGNDTVIGGSGFDILDGRGGTDSVLGNAADDALFSGENPGGDDRTVFIDSAGVVRIVGTPRKDVVDVLLDGGLVAVGFGAATKWFVEGDVTGIHADLGAGDDFIHLRQDSFPFRATLLGGDGDDEMSGGAGSDHIEGAAGDDQLRGLGGDDEIFGGVGNDTLDGEGGNDTLLGGAGFNVLRNGETNSGGSLPGLSLSDGVLRFDGTEDQDQLAIWRNGAGDLVVWLDGNTQVVDGDDVSGFRGLGNGGNDVLRLDANLALRSTMEGGLGNDQLIGGALADLLLGGLNDDRLFGNAGDDTLDGGAGTDQMFGAGGRDTADYSSRSGNLFIRQNNESSSAGRGGEADEDDLLGFDVERVLGGSGNDSFVGGDHNNTYFGGAGNDTISGNGGNDALHGQGGDDSIIGGSGNDFADGGDGNDSLYAQGGNDTLLGQGGNDRLFAADNARDTVNGGGNDDTGSVDGLDVVTSVETRA